MSEFQFQRGEKQARSTGKSVIGVGSNKGFERFLGIVEPEKPHFSFAQIKYGKTGTLRF